MPGRVIHWSVEAEPLAPASVVTIGIFDGLHLGHQALIGRATQEARLAGVPAACVSFYPSPDSVLRGATRCYLMLPSERAELMLGLGVDIAVLAGFDSHVARLSAAEFMGRLCASLHPSQVWVGEDFALGRGRRGTAEVLAGLGRELGYALRVLPRCRVDGQVISSTLIRSLLDQGEVTEAARFLGRSYSLRGPVQHGFGRGHRLGFPTANVAAPVEKQLPADGVYAGRALVSGSVYQAAINIGSNPTFEGSERTVEAFLLDFQGDLYGTQVEVEFVARLRAEAVFASVAELQEQVRADIAAVPGALAINVPETAACLDEEPRAV